MEALTWSEAMSVGVPALDADHRCLVRIIGLLQGVGDMDARRVVEIVLERLGVYSRYHFAREEEVMERINFPGIEIHRAEHAGFVRFVAGARERHLSRSNAAVAKELLDYLTAWLRHHILIQDMAYKPYVLSSLYSAAAADVHESAPLQAMPAFPSPTAGTG